MAQLSGGTHCSGEVEVLEMACDDGDGIEELLLGGIIDLGDTLRISGWLDHFSDGDGGLQGLLNIWE
jgi:hypothetical protein